MKRIPEGLSSYQRTCIRERLADGYTIIDYGRLDGDWATLIMRKGTYENRIAFPRTRAIENELSAYRH